MKELLTTSKQSTTPKSTIARKIWTLAVCWALTFSNISCGNPTQKDIMKQENKVENISFQVSHYINARKNYVKKYNTLYRYPKTPKNEADIRRSMQQLYEAISDYDKKIEKLAGQKIKEQNKLNEQIWRLGTWGIPTWPIDANRRDFLLAI